MIKFKVYLYIFFFLSGCSVSRVEPAEDQSGRSVVIRVDAPLTRSFNGTVAETWEKKINTAAVYVFNPAGKTIYVYTLKTTEITAINNGTNMQIGFIVPGNLSSCDVYIVANTTPSASITTKASFLTSFEQGIANYNGPYANVLAGALRPNGFVMTGKQDGVSLSASQTTNIGINLKRIVAKIGIDISFTAILNLGSLTLNNVTITGSAPYSNLFPLSSGNTGGNAITLSQAAQPNGANKYRAFFYLYENDVRALGGRVNINLSGSGLILIISTPFSYKVPMDGDQVSGAASGRITRNTAYYVNISVTKLTTILGRSVAGPAVEVQQYSEKW